MSDLTASNVYALITGVSGGIGGALAKAFHAKGYQVIGLDQGPISDSEVAEKCTFVQADLRKVFDDETYAQSLFAAIRAVLGNGALSVLVNNAAVQILGRTETVSREDWQQTLGVNVLAPFVLVQAFLNELESARGSVINISSIHSSLSKPDFLAYATSKAALSAMTRNLALDLGGRVRVNAIEPAAIETEMLKAGFVGKSEQYAKLEQCHPSNRIGQPEEVARLAVLLADKDIDFVNGAIIKIDGAISSRLFDSA